MYKYTAAYYGHTNSSCPVPMPYMGYLTFTSCLASLVGSALIILTFAIWKDFRTIGRAIVVFLAITDFFSALGYMFGVSVFWAKQQQHNITNYSYTVMCTTQSFITSFFPVSSFLWTLNLAIYLLAVLVLKKQGRAIWKLFFCFHLTAWGIPLIVCALGVGFQAFGPSQSLTSVDWCFITDNLDRWKYFMFEALCGKFWELCAYIGSLVIYIVIKININIKRVQRTPSTSQAKYLGTELAHRLEIAAGQFDKKLIWIPMVFILFRIWGTIRFFISLSCSIDDCSANCHANNIVLMTLQSIFDPAQGWGNALLFVAFHKPLAIRLCPCLFTGWDRLHLFFGSCCKRDGLQTPLLSNSKDGRDDTARRDSDSVNV